MIPVPPSRPVLFGVAALLGCGSTPLDPVGDGAGVEAPLAGDPGAVEPSDAPAPPPPDAGAGLEGEPEPIPTFRTHLVCGEVRVLEVAPWPGRGVQLAVVTSDPEAPITVATAGAAVPSATAADETPYGLRFLVVLPSADPKVHAARLSEAAALLLSFPPEDRVALFRAGDLQADLTRDRDHLGRRLLSIAPGDEAAPDLELLAEELGARDGPFGPLRRRLHVVGGEGPPDPAAGGVLRRVGACPNAAEGALLHVVSGEDDCVVPAPAPMEGYESLPCDPAAAADDDFPFGDTIALEMTAEEEALFHEYDEAQDEGDVTAHVRLGPSEPFPAVVHFRGQSSLSCERKSLSVNLDGGEPRRLAPGSADDELMLISLCLDDGYFNQVLANRLLAPLGVFPLEGRLVVVTLNGESRGVHLLLEKPAEAVLRDELAVELVLRRRFDPENKAEDVKWPKDGPGHDWAREQYHAMLDLVGATAPAELPAALERELDLRGYVDWMAFQTWFQNGDYVDEAWFYASREAGDLYFRVHGWDADDLISKCHHGGEFALDDPHGLLFCAEGHLDHAFLASDAMYELFADALEAMIEDLYPPAVVKAVLDGVRDDLFARLAKDEDCHAMVELESAALGCAALREEIQALMDDFMVALTLRREELLAGIAAYREAQ